ncbi:MAG: glycosyltransferase family 39 protein, partial [Anaerolineales bacterium]|nr:glycosyltransferase family 39 protein [Anaerolineales bacterium]
MIKQITQRRWVDWPAVAVIGLLLQSFWALRMSQPTYMDAYYYTTNGQRLADGYGFTEEVIWQFLDAPEGFPTSSHTYWMPLTSMVASVGYQFGDQFRAAQLPFWLLAGLLPLLAYSISKVLQQPRWVSWVAAMLTASGGFYNNFYNQPSTFALFAWTGGLCLLALAQGSRHGSSHWWWLLGGVMAGLGHLTRADGALLPVVG